MAPRSKSRLQLPIMLLGLIFTTLVTITAAQTTAGAEIDWSKLPSCAKQCSLLTEAEQACVPPTAQVTTFDTYESCFCQSALITQLPVSAQGICSDVCTSQSDLSKISSWYSSACQAGNALVATDGSSSGSQTSAVSSAAPAATSSSSSGSSSSDSSGSSSSSSSSSSSAPSGSWISTHWKWVVMLIVIFLAMVLASIIGVWLKRRYRRKRAMMAGNVAASDAVLPPGANGHLEKSYPAPIPPTGMVPPRVLTGNRRSRTPTLTSMRNSSGTLDRYSNPQPVAWGPHQHQAAWGYNADIAPPSPVGTSRGKGRADNMVGVQELPREEVVNSRTDDGSHSPVDDRLGRRLSKKPSKR